MMEQTEQHIRVDFDFPVVFTRDLFGEANPLFVDTVRRLEPDKRHRVLFVIDANVAAAHPRLGSAIARYCAAHGNSLELAADPIVVPGGEPVKNDMTHMMNLVEAVGRYRIDRHSFLAIIGGGAVLDMAGFAAAISHRSVRAIRIPTTVLSQDDSGVGVKNGINLLGKKNFIGTFQPPFAVLNDADFLSTLPHRDKIAGIAEAVKVALIRDPEFYEFLESNAARLARADGEALAFLIRRSAEIHLEHIRGAGDPFEQGSARPLDFGHWVAHKMESATNHRLRHGEAVALGMAVDTLYSMKSGHLHPHQAERVISLLERIGFSLWEEELLQPGERGSPMVLEGLREFREHLGGRLHITLLRDIGAGFEVNHMDEERVIESIRILQERFGPGGAARARASSTAAAG